MNEENETRPPWPWAEVILGIIVWWILMSIYGCKSQQHIAETMEIDSGFVFDDVTMFGSATDDSVMQSFFYTSDSIIIEVIADSTGTSKKRVAIYRPEAKQETTKTKHEETTKTERVEITDTTKVVSKKETEKKVTKVAEPFTIWHGVFLLLFVVCCFLLYKKIMKNDG